MSTEVTSPQTFKFRFFQGIRRQRQELLEAKDYAPVDLAPVLTATLTRLGELAPENLGVFTRHRVWISSIRAVLPLLIRSVSWQLVSSTALVSALFATREALSNQFPLSLTMALITLYLLADLIKNVVFFFDLQRRAQLARGVQLHLFNFVNQKLLTVDRDRAQSFSSANIKTLVSSDVESVEDFITSAAAGWIPAAVVFSVTFIPIIALMGWVGGCAIFVTLLQVPLAYFIARGIEYYKGRRQSEQDKMTNVIGEWVRNVRAIKFLNWEPLVAKQIRKSLRNVSVEEAKSHFLVCLAYCFTYCWWMFPILIMIWIGNSQIAALEPANFFTVVWLLALLSNNLQFLPNSLAQFGEASAAASRIVQFMNLPDLHDRLVKSDPLNLPSSASSPVTIDKRDHPIRLHFHNVNVDYEEVRVVDNVSISINLYEKTAIVGEVGSGKSIFGRLLCGETAPSSGLIEVEFSSGIRMPLWVNWVFTATRQYLAYATQEPFLSNSTILRNISLSGDHSDREVEDAVHAAALEWDLNQWPGRLQTEVGETGINLSGGQKQRVSLARAFISKRPFWILDDPLSAVDAVTESQLFEAFLKHAKGFVLITHRLSKIDQCDRVITFSRGTIVEDGSPVTLMSDRSSHLYSLVHAKRGVIHE